MGSQRLREVALGLGLQFMGRRNLRMTMRFVERSLEECQPRACVVEARNQLFIGGRVKQWQSIHGACATASPSRARRIGPWRQSRRGVQPRGRGWSRACRRSECGAPVSGIDCRACRDVALQRHIPHAHGVGEIHAAPRGIHGAVGIVRDRRKPGQIVPRPNSLPSRSWCQPEPSPPAPGPRARQLFTDPMAGRAPGDEASVPRGMRPSRSAADIVRSAQATASSSFPTSSRARAN